MASSNLQHWNHMDQGFSLDITTKGIWRKPGGDGDKEAKLSLQLNERKTLLVCPTDGDTYFVLDQRDISGPWKHFTTCVSDLHFPERLDSFLASAISEIGISNPLVAHQMRMQVSSSVNEALVNVHARGYCFSSLSIPVRLWLSTNYWFDESRLISLALRESENLNYNMSFGAVPATEAAIGAALSIKVLNIQESKESCMVCLDEFIEETRVNQLPCFHFFHPDCITKWLRKSNCCPVCRFRVQEKA